jgi:hypothetical protein
MKERRRVFMNEIGLRRYNAFGKSGCLAIKTIHSQYYCIFNFSEIKKS